MDINIEQRYMGDPAYVKSSHLVEDLYAYALKY